MVSSSQLQLDEQVRQIRTVDGNEAAALVAYRAAEVIAIYPITPSSTMGELADEWAAHGVPNLWGNVPAVMEMQSEGGAAGAVHGALQAGALATTFTASQGLLLMIPNLYKIAGELTPFCMHVTARTVATHALSIFGDHSDVMACRQTGLAMLCSASVQEAHDMAAIAHAATLRTRIPFMHFFDGFRTSHEIAKIELLSEADLRLMLECEGITEHRMRGLTPDRPVIRGTAQNPDTFFQAREAANRFYDVCPDHVQHAMDQLAGLTGRQYRLFDYAGHPEAERIVVIMGSGGEAVDQTVNYLVARGEKVGVIRVRLYRPFSASHLLSVLPETARKVAVLDRTKEPGALGEPLFQDFSLAMAMAGRSMQIIGGRYGLSSKEFTPAMIKAVYGELAKAKPKQQFTVGIIDDVTHLSLPFDPEFTIEGKDVFSAVFFGLGSDGTVGANKNTIKIIGETTDHYGQGYFVYDSKKSGAVTISHLRFGSQPIHAPYLVRQARFVACHQFTFLDRYDVLGYAQPGGVFLLNASMSSDEVWQHLSCETQRQIIEKQLKFYVIDAYKVAREAGMGGRINTIMQTCFFAISGVLPSQTAIEHIKASVAKTYGKKGEEVVRKNCDAIDQTLANLYQVTYPAAETSYRMRRPTVADSAPDLVRRVTAAMLANQGDLLPVSAFPVDGTWPTVTSRWEKRNLAADIPVWEPQLCIQCNKCVIICPHAAIRAKLYAPEALENAPETFKSQNYKAPDFKGHKYTIQVAPEDCTGCNLCVMVCPAKDKSNPKIKAINMQPQLPLREQERENFAFFDRLPDPPRESIRLDVKGSQFLTPLFEFSGACAGCGETPYIKLLTQLFGDRTLIANATGCSSIYGGNLPTTPYCVDKQGRGPAWANSLFEDNAEFGLGMRLAVDQLQLAATRLLKHVAPQLGDVLVEAIVQADQSNEAGIAQQRLRVEALREALKPMQMPEAAQLRLLADYLVRKNVWIVGGDGWAYDIGYSGLDHVIFTGKNVNLLVLDTEVYSNTGGQQSKATPLAAAAKFAVAGKSTPKKDLGLMAMAYGSVYVASVAMGAKDTQTVTAFLEAEAYPGPSLIIAYSHCIAHGYDMAQGVEQQKRAVDSGYWPLYRYDPRRTTQGQSPMQLDSGSPKSALSDFLRNEMRFRTVEQQDGPRYRAMVLASKEHAARRQALYEQMAGVNPAPTKPQNA